MNFAQTLLNPKSYELRQKPYSILNLNNLNPGSGSSGPRKAGRICCRWFAVSWPSGAAVGFLDLGIHRAHTPQLVIDSKFYQDPEHALRRVSSLVKVYWLSGNHVCELSSKTWSLATHGIPLAGSPWILGFCFRTLRPKTPKYAKQWPFGPCLGDLDHYSTYLWGPGKGRFASCVLRFGVSRECGNLLYRD